MEIFLLRHGIAEDASQTGHDEDRVLTPEGIEKLERTTQAMKALRVAPEVILSSPYARALQTARLAAGSLAVGSIETTECLVPHAALGGIFEQLRPRTAPAVMLVGHEPHLSRLASLLICGSPDLSITMKKGGLCKLLCDGLPQPGAATLEWLLTPKHLLMMS